MIRFRMTPVGATNSILLLLLLGGRAKVYVRYDQKEITITTCL